MKRIISMMLIISTLIICCFSSGGIMMPAQAAKPQPTAQSQGAIDKIVFGNSESEKAHDFKGDNTFVIVGGLNETARVATPTRPASNFVGDLEFTIKVDPVKINHMTVKYWGDDESTMSSVICVGDEMLTNMGTHDHMATNFGMNNVLPGRFYYMTSDLPLKYTQGKEEITVNIKTYVYGQGAKATENSRGFYAAYTHTGSYLDVSMEDQGSELNGKLPGELKRPVTLTPKDIEKKLTDFRDEQILIARDLEQPGKHTIAKYKNDMKYLAMTLNMPWSPANTPARKKSVIYRIFNAIDNHVREYYNNTKMILRGGHQGDWGGYYREIGDVLYILENHIFDENIIGADEFNRFLDQRFDTGSEEGQHSLASVGWNGEPLTRRAAWERCLKANYDFSRSRLSYIYNQVVLTYEGAWQSHEGLRIIGSQFYEGKETSHRILGELLGVRPFLGEAVLEGPDGRELDLYHSLYYHDGGAIFTEDYQQIVAKGLARSKLDENGETVHRRPFGDNYYILSHGGLTREFTYVGSYGEHANHLPEYFWRVINHEGDEEIADDILKACLTSIHGRSWVRHPGVGGDGYRTILMEQMTDNRNVYWSGKETYASGIGEIWSFAWLEKWMVEHEERYSGPEWDKYWEYAKWGVGMAQQVIADNNAFKYGVDVKRDFYFPDTYEYLTKTRQTYDRFKGEQWVGIFHPHTDFDYYSESELASYNVDVAKHEEQAWVDLDVGQISIRDGDVSIFGSMWYHNEGFTNAARLRVKDVGHEKYMTIATDGILRYEDYRMRQAALATIHVAERGMEYMKLKLGIANELKPIAYQPGVGTVIRDTNELDSPYSGMPDLLKSRYQKYYILLNTTRDTHGNSTTFSVELPADYKRNTVYDMVSKTEIPVVDGKIEIPPFTGYILKLDSDFAAEEEKPYSVTITLARQGVNDIEVMWKQTAGCESYQVMRSETPDGEYKVIADNVTALNYKDSDVTVGKTYYYKVRGVNKYGEGLPSYHTSITLTPTASLKNSEWRDDRINSFNGIAEVNGDNVKISNAVGAGLSYGDDSMFRIRDINDSFHFVNRIHIGDGVFSAKIDKHDGKLNGLMMRDTLNPNTMYLYFGANEEGRIVLNTRTRESVHPGAFGVRLSPLTVDEGTYSADEYPYIKLERDGFTSRMNALISKDGEEWIAVAQDLFMPMTDVYHIGLAATNNAEFSNVDIQ